MAGKLIAGLLLFGSIVPSAALAATSCATDLRATAAASKLAELPPEIQADLAHLFDGQVADSGTRILDTDAPLKEDLNLPTVRFVSAMLLKNQWLVTYEATMMMPITFGYTKIGNGYFSRNPGVNLSGDPCVVARAVSQGVGTGPPQWKDALEYPPQSPKKPDPSTDRYDHLLLAYAILPPDKARTIVARSINTGFQQNGPPSSVILYSQPFQVANGLCRMNVYTVTLPLDRNPATWAGEYVRLAAGNHCAAIPRDHFAHLESPVRDFREVAEILAMMNGMITDTQKVPRRAVITCVDESKDATCELPAREALAALKNTVPFTIEQAGYRRWSFSLAPGPANTPIWNIEFNAVDPKRPIINLKTRLPAPF